MTMEQNARHVLVVGAGIIGIACSIRLRQAGYHVTVVDPESPASMTSKGNAAGLGYTEVMPIAGPGVWKKVPKWLLDPLGPLFIKPAVIPELLPWFWRFCRVSTSGHVQKLATHLSAILKLSITETEKLVSEAGLKDHYTQNGALTVYKSERARQQDSLEWKLKASHGIVCEELNAQEVAAMEPALQGVAWGIFTPQWCNVKEPYEFALALATFAQSIGVRFEREKVESFEFQNQTVKTVICQGGKKLPLEEIVIAAGVWSADLCKHLSEKVLLTSEAGYNTTLPDPGVNLTRQVIFAEEKFVATPIRSGLRIGGAAEFSGLNAPAYFKRSDRLLELASGYFPDLHVSQGEKWMGRRPSTPDSLPVIGRSTKYSNVLHAFGHGHLGLTMAASTACLIEELMSGRKPSIDISPFSIDRFNHGPIVH